MTETPDARTIAAVRAGCEMIPMQGIPPHSGRRYVCPFPDCTCMVAPAIRAALAAADACEPPCMRWRGPGEEPPKWTTPCGVLKYRSREDAVDD
jgi:hypothetical protein